MIVIGEAALLGLVIGLAYAKPTPVTVGCAIFVGAMFLLTLVQEGTRVR